MTQKTLFILLALAMCCLPALAQIGPPPIITVQPLGLSVPKKGTAIFTVVAVSGTAMTYQWYFNDEKLGSETSSSVLTVSNVKAGDAGNYKVRIKNASGSVVSSNATLVVLDAKALKIKDYKLTKAGFEVSLDGVTDPRCVIYASSNMVDWVPIATNTPLSGVVNYTDSAATNRPFGYYKVLAE